MIIERKEVLPKALLAELERVAAGKAPEAAAPKAPKAPTQVEKANEEKKKMT